MAVYVDYGIYRFGKFTMCHLIADTPVELHAFATRLSLKRAWYQSPAQSSFPHYDLSSSRRKVALDIGAKEIDRHSLVERMRRVKSELISAGQTWQSAGWM